MFCMCVTLFFILCISLNFLILFVCVCSQLMNYPGWAIGFCIMVGAGASGNVSGAALNPAVALPIDVMGKGGMKMHSLAERN